MGSLAIAEKKASPRKVAITASDFSTRLGLATHGDTAKEIGEALNLSARTVEVHRARILSKTGAGSVSELAKRLAPNRSDS